MKKISVILAAAIVCSPLAAQEAEEETTVETEAEEAATEEAGEEVAETDDKNRIICRRTAVIGSKFKKRICGTQKMWDTLSARGRDSTSEFQRKGRGIRQAGN